MRNRVFRSILIIAVIVASSLITQAALPTHAQAACKADVPRAFVWLKSVQSADGGFSNGFQPGSDLGTTADAVFAASVAGFDLKQWAVGEATPLSYLEAQVFAGEADSAGELGKVLLAITGQQLAPTNFGGKDVVADTQGALDKLVADGNDVFGLSYAILGLRAVPVDIDDATVKLLLDTRNPDGGWGFARGNPSDTNTTALALQALIAADAEFDPLPTLAYLRTTQNEDNGFPYQKPSQFGTETDANSTALVAQALIAAGEAVDDWGSPDDLLPSFQLPSGSFMFQKSTPADNVLATVQVVPALCGASLVGIGLAVDEPTPEATPAQ